MGPAPPHAAQRPGLPSLRSTIGPAAAAAAVVAVGEAHEADAAERYTDACAMKEGPRPAGTAPVKEPAGGCGCRPAAARARYGGLWNAVDVPAAWPGARAERGCGGSMPVPLAAPRCWLRAEGGWEEEETKPAKGCVKGDATAPKAGEPMCEAEAGV